MFFQFPKTLEKYARSFNSVHTITGAMNNERFPWKPEDHRLYLQTWLTHLPPVLAATSRPLLGIAVVVALMNNRPLDMIQAILKLL